MNNEKNREEFIAWLKKQPHVLNVGFNRDTGKFLLDEDETAWQAWQGSRAAVVVELPERLFAGSPDPEGPDLNRDEVVAVLEAAGLKVKP